MKTIRNGLARAAILAATLVGTSASVGAAAPATTGRGVGCYVTDANGRNYLDDACRAHEVVRFGADGSLEFYAYQDAGQLPSDAAHPTSAIRNSYDACFNLGFSVVCGQVVEIIAPSGAYKSSFMAR